MNIEVRTAGKGDDEVLHDILQELHDCDLQLRKKRFTEALNSENSTYLVAISEKKAIGFLNIWYMPDIVDGGFAGIILDIYVSSNYRDRGVGGVLLESALDVGEKHNINKYYGWMAPDNNAAIALMKRYGFRGENLMFEKK